MLRIGDCVAVIAPSGPVEVPLLDAGIARLRSWGLEVVEGRHVRDVVQGSACAGADADADDDADEGWWSGADADRLADIEWALTDPSIAAVFAARGGYGLTRIIEQVRWARVKAATYRPVIGFSDVTVLHAALQLHVGWASVHGPHVAGGLGKPDPDQPTVDSIRAYLFGECGPQAAVDDLVATGTVLRPGGVTAPIRGGNLAMLAAMTGTPVGAPPTEPFIALLEDVTELPYRVDRMLVQLHQSRWFANAVGVISGIWDRCGNVEPILREHLSRVPGPIILNAAFGHADRNLVVPLGVRVTLKAEFGRPGVAQR
jgi:muramoyltetrapeptide carboxypeptidase